ncbi:MAG: tetratricopeptide repeat protein [Cyanobacteria bacterium J06628_6]
METAYDRPAERPAVFHAWGLGGVGKTTLLNKAKAAHRKRCTLPDHATIAEVKVGDTANTNAPLGVMKVLYRQLSTATASEDPFYSREQQYQKTLEQLKTETEQGSNQADEKQIELVKKYSQLALQGLSSLLPASSAVGAGLSLMAPHIGGVGELSASVWDEFKGLVSRHRATQHDRELQALMVNPLLELTKAFVAGLQYKASVQPLLLVLDFYEKVPVEVDRWLCNTLLGNTPLQQSRVRIITAGRRPILNQDHWSERHQNDQAVYEIQLETFAEDQSRQYLEAIGITDDSRVRRITKATKGLPYYLNWVREQYIKGQEPDFADGALVIKQLLLRQFTPQQIHLVQVVACCRRFDGDLIKKLTRTESLEVSLAEGETQTGRFRWLLGLPFVERRTDGYTLDDVARDVLRQVLDEESGEQFRAVNQLLATYCSELAAEEVYTDAHVAEQYDSEEWRHYQAQALYYRLFAQPREAELTICTRILEGAYFSVSEIVQGPLRAIEAEYQADEHPLLKKSLRNFLQQIGPLADYGFLLTLQQLHYEQMQKQLELSQAGINQALSLCWQRTERLEGLAKFAAYFYQANHCPEIQKLSWLRKAQSQKSEVVASASSDFINRLTFRLGYTLAESGCYKAAITSYDEALKHKPGSHEAWTNRGIALRKLGRYEAAIQSYDEALKHKPDKHEAWYNRGIALRKLGRYEAAIQSYDEALKYKPGSHEAWTNRGYALVELGRYEAAIQSYDKVIKLRPDHPSPFYNRACTYALWAKSDKALADLQQAITLAPNEYRELAKTDADFDSLRSDPRFQALIDGLV